MTVRPRLHTKIFAVLVVAQLTGCGGGGSDGSGGSSVSGSGSSTGSHVATLSWMAPANNNMDGTVAQVDGFNIYTGLSQDSLQRVATVAANTTVATVNNLPAGTIYFAVTAFSADSAESDFSEVRSHTF